MRKINNIIMEKKSILKADYKVLTNYVNPKTGKVIDYDISWHNYLANTREEFFLAYSSMLLALEEHSTDAKVKLFAYLVRMYAQGNIFAMSKILKEDMARKIGLATRTLDNTLTQLINIKFVIRVGRNAYKINPRHVFKGSTLERNKALKLILELECPDC